MKPIRYDPEAEEELREAVAWYERQRPGLGAELLAAVQQRLTVVQRRPESFPPFGNDGHRKCLVGRFPYTIFFQSFDEEI